MKHTIIADNAGGHYMQEGRVDLCIVGTDRVTANGDVANKIGTYLKALAAKDNDVPFYVALPSSTIDWTLANGRDIPIEERSPDELLKMTRPHARWGTRDGRDRGAGFRPPPIPVSTSRRRVSSPVSSPNAALAPRTRAGPALVVSQIRSDVIRNGTSAAIFERDGKGTQVAKASRNFLMGK